MDPITALGVAAAAVGFFDCAIGLFKDWSKVRDDRRVLTFDIIRKTANDLLSWKATLEGQGKLIGSLNNYSSDDEMALQELLKDCAVIAQKLSMKVESLQSKVHGNAWFEFRQALQTIWTADDLQSLCNQLVECRSQIVLRVLSLLNTNLNLISFQQQQRFNRLDDSSNEIVSVLALNREDLTDHITSHFEQVTQQLSQQRNESRRQNQGIIEAILTLNNGDTRSVLFDKGDSAISSRAVDMFLGKDEVVSLKKGADGDIPGLSIEKVTYLQRMVLECLDFRTRNDRIENVKEAHRDTFRWIFSRDNRSTWSNFPDWLRSQSGCYWINGKAGSGKSTLMKFIWNHDETQEHLHKWAGTSKLLTASFFFWYLGTPLQKSQTGLLRSLLHDVLDQRPDLITRVMPDLCREAFKSHYSLPEPSTAELIRWFRNLRDAISPSSKICFFIDGLDEYTGDHLNLNAFLLEMSTSQDMKFVLSSRPITACTDAFSELPRLRLQDITKDDIRRYAEDSLKIRFKREYNHQWDEILQEIVEKASGVFMWVSLVVKSLYEGLRDGDTLVELKQRLDELPSDLKDLYRHMLERIPSKYRQQSGEIFQIVLLNFLGLAGRAFLPSLSAFQLSLALESDYTALHAPIKRISNSELVQRTLRMDTRIRSRCLGLLEVHNLPSATLQHAPLITYNASESRVMFIHKSAVEFFQEIEMQNALKELTNKTDFNPHAALFRSCLMTAKAAASINEIGKSEKLLWNYLAYGLLLAREAEKIDLPLTAACIKELDRTFTIHWRAAKRYQPPGRSTRSYSKLTLPCEGHWFRKMVRIEASSAPEALDGNDSGFLLMIRDYLRHPVYPPGTLRLFPYAIARKAMSPYLFSSEEALGIYRVAITYSLASFIRNSVLLVHDPSFQRLNPKEATTLLCYVVHNIAFLDFGIWGSQTAREKFSEICDTLFVAGANPNAAIYGGAYTVWTLLLRAASFMWAEMLSNGAKNFTSKIEADLVIVTTSLQPCMDVLESFIRHEADIRVTFPFLSQNHTPSTALSCLKAEIKHPRAALLAMQASIERCLLVLGQKESQSLGPVQYPGISDGLEKNRRQPKKIVHSQSHLSTMPDSKGKVSKLVKKARSLLQGPN